PGDITGGDDTALKLLHPAYGVMRTSLERVQWIARAGERPPDAAVAATQSAEDRVELANGDRTTGLVDRIDAAGVSVQTGTRRQVIGWSAIRSLLMAQADPAPRQTGLRLRVQTSDASILLAREIEWTADRVQVTRSEGETVGFPAADVRRVEVIGWRWQWPSEMPVASYESIPFLSRRWPLVRDASVTGQPLRCNGRTYARGIGLHSAAKAKWNLDGAPARFIAS